jgi:hypothetical protein
MYNVTIYKIGNNEVRSRNHCCRGKTSITYVSVCVRPRGCPGACMCVRACSLANPTCNVHATYCIVICGLSGSTTFLHITSQTAQFSERSKWTFNLCFGFLYNFHAKHFSLLKFSQILSQMWKSLQVKYQLFFSDLIKLAFLDLTYQILSKSAQSVPSCSLRMHGQTWWS